MWKTHLARMRVCVSARECVWVFMSVCPISNEVAHPSSYNHCINKLKNVEIELKLQQ